MLIVLLIDQTRLGDKSRLFSWLVENSSKVMRGRCGQKKKKTANEAVFHRLISEFFLGSFGHVLTDPVCVKLELAV